jgi:hypothetical protein
VSAPTSSACHRCAAAGQRGSGTATSAPFWDPAYRMCGPCLAAVLFLLDATGTRPVAGGVGKPFAFPHHPAHTGAPHYLWRPDSRGLAAQVADADAARSPSPATAATRAGVGDPRTLSGPGGGQ